MEFLKIKKFTMKKNNTKKMFPIFIALQSFAFLSNGQITTFQKIYPTATVQNQYAKDVLPTPDGGYMMVSATETSIVNDLDIMIVKTDSFGNIIWTKTYGGSKPDVPNGMLETADGNYFVVGYKTSAGGEIDNYLLKLKPNGDTLFTKVFGGYGNEEAKEIVATADGNYVIVGASNSVNYADNNFELIKIDPFGNVIWTKYYGGPNYEAARSVKLCSDGGFILAGKTKLTTTSNASIFLVKTNSSGDTLWSKTYGGPNSYEAKSILANADGTYTFCADDSSYTNDSDVLVMNVSATGFINWTKSFGGTDKDICKMINPTFDGGYIVAAISRSFGWINPDMWLLKLDASGNTQWTSHFGGQYHEHCYAARQTADGGYIAAGQSRSYSVNIQMMLVKLDSLGKINPLGNEEFASKNMILNVYPNPTDGVVNIDLSEYSNSPTIIKVNNSLGQVLYSEVIDQMSGTKNKVIDLKYEQPGIYFVTVQSANNLTTKKLVLK
ncbi:MAG: hypothetical protein A3F72_07085 [Bacteroidetes bacterium RIFCSPLOWO2_12_FULL_35_15]|nr:MAG: hypothetical protein A3F72_07085 [Bacteroidetes bacterium RIFCSPLOWO2_12_FULL_35_15]